MNATVIQRAGLVVFALIGAVSALGQGQTAETRAPDIELRDGVPGPDQAALPESLAQNPPVSRWLENRTRRYAALFKGTRCDVLLVPMQVEGNAFDRPSRDIMTADLARALGSQKRCVTDPYLVDLALGEGLRHRSPEAVRELARTIRAREIITIYSGHYGPGQMRITLQRLRTGVRAATIAARSFQYLGYDDEHPPFTLFHAHLPEMLSAVGLKVAKAQGDVVPGAVMPAALPDSFDAYLQPDRSQYQSPVAASAALTFLAIQGPSSESRAADRLFSKAWVALASADDTVPAVRRLQARIMLHLHERPFALHLLGNDWSPEAGGLRGVLNGNLPEARVALSLVKDPWERFLLGIEVVDLELAYERDARATTSGVMGLVQDSQFAPFVDQRLLDRGLWGWHTTYAMESTLDTIPAFSRRAKEDAESDDPSVDESIGEKEELESLRRVHQFIDQQPRQWCCGSFSTIPRASDLLDMLDSRIEYALDRQVYFLIAPQGSYEKARALLESYDAELAGSPAAEALRASIYSHLMRSGNTEHRADQSKRMHDAALLAAWWTQAQTPDMASAVKYLAARPADASVGYFQTVTTDYPIRPYWRTTLGQPTGAARLAFSTEDPGALLDLQSESSSDVLRQYLAAADTRFFGGIVSTERRLRDLSPGPKGEEQLRAEIKVDPDNYQLYRTLANLQLRQKRYAEVRGTILSYPPFGESEPNDPVLLSNYASRWGLDLLWLDQVTEAQPLLEKSTGYNTGSKNEYWAAAHLALLDKQYPKAAERFRDIGSRYDDLIAYRELTSLLLAAGHDKSGWALFDTLTQRYMTKGLWTAAMVGHRRGAETGVGLAAWYAERLRKVPWGEARDNLRGHAFLEIVIDRQLSAEFPEQLRSLSSAPDAIVRQEGKVYFTETFDNSVVIGPSGFGKERHERLTSGSIPPDRYALAAAALLALQAGQFADAAARFDELSSYYSIERDFVLPYFAYSAARSGDGMHLRAYLETLPADAQGFEVTLARAVFTALGKNPADALALLDKAFTSWAGVHGDYFPASGYQYVNVCALLYEATRDPSYREAALPLARLLRRVEPAFAFGHAAVAYLSTDDKERVDALAVALYLDPRSRWASKVPRKLQAAAKASMTAKGNPFANGDDERRWAQIDAELAAGAEDTKVSAENELTH